ncbi:MAG: phospholipid carrier-dependent glycosyltransferase, partial [Bifidobacteriaceae bacterium]|nr:phospholipid carrier-dependent glycosyltransferase [Bifidobacteriaceae bacterium]
MTDAPDANPYASAPPDPVDAPGPAAAPPRRRRRSWFDTAPVIRFQIWLATAGLGRLAARWFFPIAITALAGVMRLIHLGFPHKLVFDETFYVKEGYSLLRHGYERKWPDGDETNPSFESGDIDIMLDQPEYVVHPPVGKWMIALGQWLFGGDSSFGWRFGSALAGTISVFILILVARRLLRSQFLACVAGLLLAVDGEHLVHSRTGLLDLFLMFWALLAFYLILVDREQFRRRLEKRMGRVTGHSATGAPVYASRQWGPRAGLRWALLGAGVALGLATGVKWSGAYFLIVFGLLVVAWDAADRRALGIRRWAAAGILLDGVKDFFTMVPAAVAAYLAGWAGWFASTDAWGRHWAQDNPGQGVAWLPAPLRSLLEYHRQAYDFHTSLTTEHNYQANPLGWLAQARPTSFFWETEPTCGSDNCAQAITSVGNPVIWWLGIAALLLILFYAVFWADRRAWAILAGYAAGYLPWMLYLGRTVFTFYTVAFVPFVVLAVTYALGVALGPPEASR